MTAVEKTRGSFERQHKSRTFAGYVGVGIAAIAVGIGVAYGTVALTGSTETAAQRAAVIRGSQVAEHIDELNSVGLAQQTAIDQRALLQSRIHVGLAQQAAIEQQQLLQSRIQAGLAQANAIESARSAKNAWQMRGREMANHLDVLVAAGLAQQAAAGQ